MPHHEIRNDINCIYLHGFASGPRSKKAVFFSERLSDEGIAVTIPDLNGSDFANMTITSQIKMVMDLIDKSDRTRPLVLFGSSMGGLVATLVAEMTPVDALVLLAPGFNLPERWRTLFPAEAIEDWEKTGFLDVFHYAFNANMRLGYGFVHDVAAYQTDNRSIYCPTLVMHGSDDDVVPIENSERFAAANQQYVRLITLEDNHDLVTHLDLMWRTTREFLIECTK